MCLCTCTHTHTRAHVCTHMVTPASFRDLRDGKYMLMTRLVATRQEGFTALAIFAVHEGRYVHESGLFPLASEYIVRGDNWHFSIGEPTALESSKYLYVLLPEERTQVYAKSSRIGTWMDALFAPTEINTV